MIQEWQQCLHRKITLRDEFSSKHFVALYEKSVCAEKNVSLVEQKGEGTEIYYDLKVLQLTCATKKCNLL